MGLAEMVERDGTPAGENLLARDIRALRKARRLTLAQLALSLGRSVGWMS